MKLASFKANGRASYGVVTDSGIIDLGRKLTQYPTLLDLLRAQALAQARAAAKGAADYQIKELEMLPPIPAPEIISSLPSSRRTTYRLVPLRSLWI